MRPDRALRLAKHCLARYELTKRDKRGWRWRQNGGKYISQWLIPRCSAQMFRTIERHMAAGVSGRVQTVDPHLCYSNQSCLSPRTLAICIRDFALHRRRPFIKLPFLFEWHGRYYVWDGNHRVTAAILLDKPIRALVVSVRMPGDRRIRYHS